MRDEGAGGVRAQTNGDAVCKSFLCAGDHALHDDVAVEFANLAHVRDLGGEVGARNCGRYRADLHGARFLKQPYHVLVGVCAVLNGIYTVFKRSTQSGGAFNMRRHLVAEPVRLVAAGTNKLRRHLEYPRLTLYLCVEDAAGYHYLYKVGLVFGDLADISDAVVLGFRFVSQQPCHMPLGHGDRHVRNEHPRPDALALVYIVADA